MASLDLGSRRLEELRRALAATDDRFAQRRMLGASVRPGQRFASLRDRLVRDLSKELEAESGRR